MLSAACLRADLLCFFIQCIYMQTVNCSISRWAPKNIFADSLYWFPLQLSHINDQWAQDYESLIQKMPANSTGYYSTCSSTNSYQHIPICTQCMQLEKKLDESRNEVCQINAKLEALQDTIHQSNQQVAHLGNASRAIQNQVYRLFWELKLFIDVHICIYCHNIAALAAANCMH